MAHIPNSHSLPANELNIEYINMLDFETEEMLF